MSSTTPGGPGDGATLGQPPEPTHTAEQLVIIHAAMMEELGVGRKDELPLADRGFDDAIAIRPIRQPVTGMGAAWHNLQFDDVDPADEELDSIADGQLYRLRRGASYNSQQHNSRGRGGFAPRGGPTQRGDFGQRGGFAPRGGRASPGRGRGRERDFGRRTPASLHSTTPQTFFNDARVGVNKHTRVDEFIANLRASHNANNTPRRKKKRGDSTLPQNHQNVPVQPVAKKQPQNSRESRRAQLSASSTWSLASSSAFLAHIGMNTNARGSTSPAPRPLTAVSNASSGERATATTPRVAAQEVDSNTPTSGTSQPMYQGNKENKGSSGNQSVRSSAATPIAATSQSISQTNKDIETLSGKQSAGLSTSRWASSKPIRPEQPVRREIEREHGVSIIKDGNPARPGQARIWKTTPGYKLFTLELEMDGKIVINEKVDFDAQLSHDGDRVITYQAAERGQSPPVWQVLFRMPYMAANFYQSLLDSLPSRSAKSPSAAGTLQPTPSVTPSVGLASSIAPSAAPAFMTPAWQTTDTQHSGDIQTAAITPSAAIAEPTSLTPAPAAKSASGNIKATSELGSAFAVVNDFNTGIKHEQNDVMMSVETWAVPSKDQCQVLVEFSSAVSPENPQLNGANRISSQVFREMSELAGVTPLVSFSDNEDDDEDETEIIPSAVQDLNEIDDSAAIEGMFSKLNNRPQGTFLQQLSAIVTEHGVPPVEQLTAEDLRHSPWAKAYMLASQTVVGNFLSDSEIFKKLPDFMSLFWVTDKSEKILDKAIQQHEPVQVGQPENPDDTIEPMKVEEKVIKAEPDVEVSPIAHISPAFSHLAQEFDKPVKVEQQGVSRRAVFSIEELLEYRKYACEVQGELIEKKYLGKHYQPPNEYLAKYPKSQPISSCPSRTVLTPEPAVVASSEVTLPTVPEPTTMVHSVMLPPATAPENWKTVQVQQTDMAAWDAILNKKTAKSGGQGTVVEAKPEIKPANPPRSTGHVPTNSDCDRLAQKLEGWHLDAELSEQQVRPETASSVDLDQVRLMALSTINPGVAVPPRPSSVASKASTSASQSMTEKLTAALTVPFAASPRIKNPIHTIQIRLQAIEGQLNPSGIKSGQTGSAFEASVQASAPSPSVADEVPTAQNGTVPIQIWSGPVAAAQEPLLAAPDVDSSRSVSPAAGLAVNVSPTVAHADHFPEVETPTPSILSPRAQLRSGPGLSASRWASEEGNGPVAQPSYARSRASSSQLFGSANAPAFQPSGHSGNMHFHPQPLTDHRAPLGVSPLIPTESGPFVPVKATVITVNPVTGELIETEGFLKTGSAPVAHAPVHPMGPPKNQENIPMGPQTFVPIAPYNHMHTFPARPDMYARHLSESSGSDVNFCSPLSPNGRMEPPANLSTSRQALSPVRGGQNNLQAELQSRLNNSLATRQNTSSPAR
ncbi:uncharacterized protein PAC_09561 [Phialocephala subalpina]|uniref:Uncharacterized protein n=1 Tax=Phialocephala subalpina TaxID=576137 RepID=A0A1L7X3V1_9HELO|nr:uncharacterized protein PAC_09561 [Phialocephala subalpina]